MNNLGGGAERVLADITNGLVSRGHDVSIVSFDAPGGTSFYELDNKIDRYQLNIGSTNTPASVLSTIKRIWCLKKTIKDITPHIIIGFMHSMFIPLSIALIGSRIPLVASEHIVPKHYENRRLEFFLWKFALSKAQKTTVVSEQVKQSFPVKHRGGMVVVPNPVSVLQGNKSQRVGLHKTVISVGRLEPQKGHELLLKAFANIIDAHPDWKLSIFGEGILRPQLEELISDLNICDKVELPGVSHNIHEEYGKASLFVMPSFYESFGLTTAEALAHNLPVIAFGDCQGVNEMVEDGYNGLLVFSYDDRITGLTAALEKVMSDQELLRQYSKNACLPKNHSINDSVCKWEKLLKEISRDFPNKEKLAVDDY